MERIVGEVGPGRRGRTADHGAARTARRSSTGSRWSTDVNTQFGLHIDEEAYNTVGGYVLGRLGRRARVGDRVRGRTADAARRGARRTARRARVPVEGTRGTRQQAAGSEVSVGALRRQVDAQQPQPVGDHDERRAHVGDHRHPERRVAGRWRARERRASPPGRARCSPGRCASSARLRRIAKGSFRQVVAHQGDVGGLERGVAAGRAHRDADVGGGQRRRVVDAVADHRHGAP